MATPVGTPPNVLFLAEYERQTGASIGFMDWIRVALPMVFLLLPATWFALTRGLKLDQPIRMPEVGSWRPCERRVLCVFLVTAFAWVFRTAPFGGWVQLIGAVDAEGAPTVGDSTVALASALALFLIPSGGNVESTVAVESDTSQNLAPTEGSATDANEHGSRFEALLDWETAVRIPWGILLLFGGGLVLADGFQTTGLSDRIGQTLAGLNGMPPLVIVFAVCLLVNFLTELTSSTATTALLLPILAETARAAQLPLEMIMNSGNDFRQLCVHAACRNSPQHDRIRQRRINDTLHGQTRLEAQSPVGNDHQPDWMGPCCEADGSVDQSRRSGSF